LIKDLPSRQKEIISRRFVLFAKAFSEGRVKGETLESIGKSYGITRERVRQIEENGISRIKPKIKKYQKTFQYFTNQLKNWGGLKKEDILLQELGGRKFQPQIYFLLTLGPNFKKVRESDEFYSLWTIDQNSLVLAKKVIDSFYNQLQKINHPLSLNTFKSPYHLSQTALLTYLEISKKIQKNSEGLFGLKDWPEINPRGVKDKAYLVFKKEGKPLHFREVSKLIGKALPQTVHNELIKDPRFVLIGRGIYALREWGYEPGQVKDIIFKILEKAGKPLTKEEILKKVLQQRLVKESTILLNLSNKKYFLKSSQGYTVRKA